MTFLHELFARAWELITTGVLLLAVVAIFAGRGAPADPDDEECDDTAAWDRGHDQWIDEQMGVW